MYRKQIEAVVHVVSCQENLPPAASASYTTALCPAYIITAKSGAFRVLTVQCRVSPGLPNRAPRMQGIMPCTRFLSTLR